ncbi:NACHT domain-containing protein [Methylorubrum extorquens]|uniref:hypothetical protein n=1 Tax=Methylorubrum extorquens TaxID=408 RepID=UPI001EE5B531|nr:hypothetical protein [Methylorubrum extorquens]MCG5248095.1 hypothetical protein [Methylorubrum extorquens]
MSGRGTAGGVVFQSEVGALAAALLLAERPLSRLGFSLLGTPRSIKFETPSAVDDLLIETDLGEIYVQAKRTISVSSAAESELASVVDQFVRQFRAGVAESSVRRAFSPLRDRLVLAVGSETTAPAREHLRTVLDRFRTGAATGLSKQLQNAIDAFTALVDAAWLAQTGTTITAGDRDSLLNVCAVVEVGHTQRQVVEEGLRDITAAGGEGALIDLLITWAATASQNGVGGDGRAIRAAMLGKASLREAPSLEEDLRRLSENTSRVLARLERFTKLPSPEGEISIYRPVTDVIVQAVRDGSLALTGEPGAGKSAIVHAAASMLGSDATVVALTVEASATSLEILRQELGLKRSVVEVFSQTVAAGPSYLLIDALDTVRGGTAEATYKRLVEEVSQLPGWRILASIRTFDLRLGKDWRRLFAGTPPDQEYSDGTFASVRHVHVGLLGSAERDFVATRSSSLASAIQVGGDKLEQLARNPFNLALLGDLLGGGVAANTFSTVTTRGQLLDRYWEERVGDLGLVATTSLTALVSLMLSARSIDIPETSVPIPAASAIEALHGVGVLVTEATRRVAFRHHILFDFAVAKLILLPDQIEAARHFGREGAGGLLIVASLGYWFEELKTRLAKTEFWRFVLTVVGGHGFDPIVRVDLARLAVEQATTEDAATIAEELLRLDAATNNAFHHLAGALISKLEHRQPADVALWANVLERLGVPRPQDLGSARNLLIAIATGIGNAGDLLDRSVGTAARNLFDAMSAEPSRISWLAPVVISIIAKTWSTDPAASRVRLTAIFEADRFEQYAFVEVPWLARESLSIAPHDADLVIDLFYRSFRGANFSRDQVTALNNSWIMGLTSNAAQDFQSASHALSRDFPDLLAGHPETALRAFSAAVRGEQERSHPINTAAPGTEIWISGVVRPFVSDNSYVWASNIDKSDHGDLARMFQALIRWASTPAGSDLANTIPSLILSETGIALAWRTLLQMAAADPGGLGLVVWRAAIERAILMSLDTVTDAVALLAAIYPFLSSPERVDAETTVLALDFSHAREPEKARISILGRLFETIGPAALVSDDARSFLSEIKADGRTFENARPYSFRISSGPSRHWLEREGVDVEAPAVSALLDLAERVRSASKRLNEDAENGEQTGSGLWPDVIVLKQAIAEAGAIDRPLDQDVSDALAVGLGTCLVNDLVPTPDRTPALTDLIQLSKHAYSPPIAEDGERLFAECPAWGSPSPRIEAARKIALLACRAEYWPLVRDSYETLLHTDWDPAVRFQLVPALPHIHRIDATAMWTIVEKVLASEGNGAVLKELVVALSLLPVEDQSRVEALILPLVAVEMPEQGDDTLTGLLMFFAIDRNMAPSRAMLSGWIANFTQEEPRLRSALYDLRGGMLLGLDDRSGDDARVRRRTLQAIWELVDTIEPFVRSLPLSTSPATPEELAALKLFDEVADQIFFAVGQEEIASELTILPAKKQFLDDYGPLLSKLMTLGTPRAVYHLLSAMNFVVDGDPARCFDLFSEAMLRTTGVARYEHEKMGADLFVKLVGLYLADHRDLLDDDVRRKKLIDCIALFVEAGWPEARRLFQNLPELLQ